MSAEQREEASPGYQDASPGYQHKDEAESQAGEPAPTRWDPDFHLDPEEARVRLDLSRGMPVAGPGLAGYAIERSTGKMVHLGGELQWDVLNEPLLGPDPRGAHIADGAADRSVSDLGAADGGLTEAVVAARAGRRPWQVNVRLSDAERDQVDQAAATCGVSRTTLARVLLLRGSRAILDDSPD